MPDKPIADALAKPIEIPDLPPNEGGIGVTATQGGDVGVVASLNNDIGKPGGWSLTAWAQWWKSKGWSAGTWVGWKKKP